MYAFFEGKVEEITGDTLILNVGGVGYQMTCDLFTLSSLKIGRQAKIYTYLQVREDAMTLYGFHGKAVKEMFETLIAVNGVGPKVAVKVLSKLKPDEIALAVLMDNSAAFKGISGAGTKIISRIMLELKSKLGESDLPSGRSDVAAVPVQGQAATLKEAADGLMGLGFSYNEAVSAVKAVLKEGMPVEEVIFQALKMGKAK